MLLSSLNNRDKILLGVVGNDPIVVVQRGSASSHSGRRLVASGGGGQILGSP